MALCVCVTCPNKIHFTSKMILYGDRNVTQIEMKFGLFFNNIETLYINTKMHK